MFPSISESASEFSACFQELYEDDEVSEIILDYSFASKQESKEKEVAVSWSPQTKFVTNDKKV